MKEHKRTHSSVIEVLLLMLGMGVSPILLFLHKVLSSPCVSHSIVVLGVQADVKSSLTRNRHILRSPAYDATEDGDVTT